MNVVTNYIEFETRGKFDVLDITDRIYENLRSTLFEEGNVTIFNPGSTAGISTLEYESGLVKDIQKLFEKMIPEGVGYGHDQKWNDGNGHAHLRSTLLKTSLTVPFRQSKLLLGTWQQVIFIEFDNRPRQRRVITQFIGK